MVLAILLAACGEAAGPAPEAAPAPEPGRVDEPATEPDDSPVEETPDEATDDPATPGEGPAVVAVNAPIADLVGAVMGDRGEVIPLMPHGADHHTYEPSPGDVAMLEGADGFFGNGLDLNPDVIELARTNLADDAPLVLVAEEAVPEGEVIRDDGHHHGDEDPGHAHAANPHAWMSPAHAQAYVDVIAAALADADPSGADTYRDNAEAYQEDLAAADGAIAAAVGTIPAENRNVVTFHDSWEYFLPHYGLEPVAAVQPSDYSDPSAAEIRDIIDQVRAEDVPAVFGSEQFPSGVLDAIAEETGAAYHGDLSDERLPGEPGDPEHSYVGLMVESARTIVEALGGDAEALDAVDPAR